MCMFYSCVWLTIQFISSIECIRARAAGKNLSHQYRKSKLTMALKSRSVWCCWVSCLLLCVVWWVCVLWLTVEILNVTECVWVSADEGADKLKFYSILLWVFGFVVSFFSVPCLSSTYTLSCSPHSFSLPTARTIVIATVSPASKDTEHSLNTLRHACIMHGQQDKVAGKAGEWVFIRVVVCCVLVCVCHWVLCAVGNWQWQPHRMCANLVNFVSVERSGIFRTLVLADSIYCHSVHSHICI